MARNLGSLLPGIKYGHKVQPNEMVSPLVPVETGNIWYVDGDRTTGGSGTSWDDAFGESDFDGALTDLSSSIKAGDVIYVAARTMSQTDTDPVSYTTNLTIDIPQISLIGVSRGRTQGGLPQLKVGGTTTQSIVRVRAPGVSISGIGINGSGATGGGIRFDDDGGTTYASFGGSVSGCHFKDCVGTTANNAATGGAVQLSGAPWQMYIGGNRFYKNVGDVVLLDTSSAVPQDIVIEDNSFSGPAANVDCNLYLRGGSGINGITIHNNVFPQLPALGGTNDRYIDATACVGMLTGNYFGAQSNTTGGTTLTWLAAGTAAKIPTTMHVAGNWGQGITAGESGTINIGADT
ncbi:hypothetical protein LCGC14_1459270 [marine sediment metagenome]|uniref:Right handed beta helix domain-containing protein n=1 Tax=marine sediment metagenome TaxID=412755 RepID=A0A0F9JFI5_9ZZZZ